MCDYCCYYYYCYYFYYYYYLLLLLFDLTFWSVCLCRLIPLCFDVRLSCFKRDILPCTNEWPLYSSCKKRIQESLGFWIPGCGFRIPDTEFLSLSVELGFRILIFRGIPDPISCIPDYRAQDCEFHKEKFPRFRPQAKFPGFRNLDSLTWEQLDTREKQCQN